MESHKQHERPSLRERRGVRTHRKLPGYLFRVLPLQGEERPILHGGHIFDSGAS